MRLTQPTCNVNEDVALMGWNLLKDHHTIWLFNVCWIMKRLLCWNDTCNCRRHRRQMKRKTSLMDFPTQMPRRDCGQGWERCYRGSLHKVSQPVTVGTFEQSTHYVEGLLTERARLVGVRMFKRYILHIFESITSKLTRLATGKCMMNSASSWNINPVGSKSTISKGVVTWIALTLFTITPKHFVIRIDARFEALAWIRMYHELAMERQWGEIANLLRPHLVLSQYVSGKIAGLLCRYKIEIM